ncbi:MAG: hypothetical protein ACI868_001742, partial [Granulosicoccus sp.]
GPLASHGGSVLVSLKDGELDVSVIGELAEA